MNTEQAMQFIFQFSKSGEPVKNLDRIMHLLNALGNPQEKLAFVHIAGTNGKGSVAEYLTNILQCSGYRTGTLTSPYIRHYRDRIRLNGKEIPENALNAICEQLKLVINEKSYSQFELTLAIALIYFVQEKAEIVILETGIGGLLDATNCITRPLVSILTSISKDHMEILGNTIEEIAMQKAGIIKNHCPVVISPNNKGEKIFRKVAEEKHCIIFQPEETKCIRKKIHLTGNDFDYETENYHTRMGGNHQIDNALTVLEAVKALRMQGISIPEKAVHDGLEKTIVPARIQIMQENPLVVLDGGHNAEGIGVLTDLLSESGIENWIGICGMTKHKDADAAAFQLALVFSRVLCVDQFTENAMPKEKLCEAFTRQHALAEPFELEKALPYALKWAKGSHGAVVICGSLYLASDYLNREWKQWN